MTLLVTGSRTWEDERIVKEALSRAAADHDTLIHGNAVGLDRMAARLGEEFFDYITSYPVTAEHWNKFGRSAGMKRNMAMVDKLSSDDLVLGFIRNGSSGTKQCINYARSKNLTVVVFEQNYPEFWLDT